MIIFLLTTLQVIIIFFFFLVFFFNQVGIKQIFLVVLLVNFYLVQGEDQMFEKLESVHGGKRDSYQDIEDPNQTMTQLSINSRTLYEDMGDLCHNLCDSATEGCRNKRRRDEGKMGLDLVEKPTLTMNHIQRLGGCMAYSKQCSIRNVSTSLPVSHHLSSCYYS